MSISFDRWSRLFPTTRKLGSLREMRHSDSPSFFLSPLPPDSLPSRRNQSRPTLARDLEENVRAYARERIHRGRREILRNEGNDYFNDLMLIDLMLFKKEKEKGKRKYYRTISNERKRERQSRRVSTNISGATLTLISGFCSPIRTSEGGRERKERGSHARHIGIHAACILRPYSAILHIEHPCPCMRVYIYIRA